MKMYTGVVENIFDPLKLGRVQVRVFGLHTDDTSLIPTKSLPWATVALPTTSASISGIGTSSGLLQGSWVFLYFLDADCQYPVVTSTFYGIPSDYSSQLAADEDLEFTESEQDSVNVLRDSSGEVVKTQDGDSIKVTPTKPEVSQSNRKVIPSQLGSISAKFESGGGNPGIINESLRNIALDGAAYGAYQLVSYLKSPGVPSKSSVTAAQIANSPVRMYIKQSAYASEFAGLEPSSKEFDAKWKQLAKVDKTGFFNDQHAYAEKIYYQKTISKLSTSIINRGKAIHEAIWSTSIQYGQTFAASIINSAIGNLDSSVCDDKAVEILYDYKIRNVRVHFKSSPDVWDLLTKNRFPKEKADLIALAKTYETADSCGTVVEVPETKITYVDADKKVVETQTKLVSSNVDVRKKGDRGFRDPDKKYPLYYSEADTNRLARGVLTGTIVETKRASLITGVDVGSTTISEPATQYNAKYPYNRVTASQSGHIIEIDDTPGYERVHIYHRSGTFIEFHPDGKLVTRVRGNNTVVVNGNDNSIILGSKNDSIESDSNSSIGGNLNLVVSGNVAVQINGNATIDVSGDSTMNVSGTASIKSPKINLN